MLLLALGATFFVEGVAEPGNLQRAIATILIGGTLVLALYAAEIRPGLLRVAAGVIFVLVAVVVIASLASDTTAAVGITSIVNGMLVALAPPAVVVGIWRNLRVTGTVTLTVVAGVLCLYLLVGLFFAFVYGAVENLGAAPFFANGDAATSSRAVYFSFVTMTTVGYGDFTARTNLGHTLAVTEALLGQIYLVTVVAAIVGRKSHVRGNLQDRGAPQRHPQSTRTGRLTRTSTPASTPRYNARPASQRLASIIARPGASPAHGSS
jgi:hypothetical protein